MSMVLRSRLAIHSGSTVSLRTEDGLYFMLVTDDTIGRKYVPPKLPALSTSSGVRFGLKSFMNCSNLDDGEFLESCCCLVDRTKDNSPLELRLGSSHRSASMTIEDGGRTGGFLYKSFF